MMKPRLSTIAIFIALIGLIYSYLHLETLPDSISLDSSLNQEPIQKQTQEKSFEKSFEENIYRIDPLYDYEIWGLVVSQRDLDDAWFNIYYDQDPYNLKDLCIIWGDNLLGEKYQKVSFWSEIWTCYYQYQRQEDKIREDQLSNNHILPATPEISQLLESVEIGDQVRLKGHLVNYQVNGGSRRTSTVRNDTGQGACEVVYTKELNILHSSNRKWRQLYHVSWIVLLGVSFIKLRNWWKS